MSNPWPDTREGLVALCEELVNRYDLYELGRKSCDGESDMPDGTDYLAGEWRYGVSMVPCQWVLRALEEVDA